MIVPSRTINSRGLELVKYFEGCKLTAYQDEVGIWTIGYGHTGLQHKDGTVYKGRAITQTEAEWLLGYDMHQFECRCDTFIKAETSSDEFSACVSFDFNTGAIAKSTLLKKLNARDHAGASLEFPRWNKAGGKVLKGLVRRRASEQNLFLGKPKFLVTT